MNERDWASESVTIAEEGKTRSPEDILTDPPRPEYPLDALPVHNRALYRVVYRLDPSWEDVQYIARATDTSPQDVLDRIRAAYRKNTPRRAESEKLMEKIAGAYSRLYQLEEEEQKLREEQAALAHQKPVDEKKGEAVARKLQKVWNNMERLQALREKWREESKKPWRIPSKEVAAIFNLTPNTVDKRVGRIGEQVRQLLGGWREEDGS